MESTDSSTGSQHPQLPPGFRFHPTDEELLVHYLKKKAASAPLPVAIIAEVDLYKFDPWELPRKAIFGEQEWYFFSPRDRKYPNGARPNRAATSGYWKATGTDKPILTANGTQKVGVKKALVFYGGKPPKGIKTNWIMHEYRLLDSNSTCSSTSPKPPFASDVAGNKKNSLRLDDWVLCRIYKKNNAQRPMEGDKEDSMEGLFLGTMTSHQNLIAPTLKSSYGMLSENDEHFFDGILAAASHEQGMQNSATASIPHQLPAVLTVSKPNMTSVGSKRGPPTQCWNDQQQGSIVSSPTKRFHADLNAGGSGNQDESSFVSLLNQLPQGGSFNPNTLMNSLGDGAFRQQYQVPNMNWNS